MSLHDQSIAVYRSRIDTMLGLITKAEAHSDGDALLEAALAEDMHPLATQIRFVTNIPGEALARLTERSFTSNDENPKTFAEAKERLAETAALLDGVEQSELPDAEQRVEFSIGDGAFNFELSAEEYVRQFSLPNFYFHLTTAYAILRMKGLEIGKADFIPHMARYFKAPAS